MLRALHSMWVLHILRAFHTLSALHSMWVWRGLHALRVLCFILFALAPSVIKKNLNKSVDWLTISPGSSLIKISFPKVAEIGFSF